MTDSTRVMIEQAIQRADEGIGRADRHAAGTCACGDRCDTQYWVETRAFWFGQSAYWRGKHQELTSIGSCGYIGGPAFVKPDNVGICPANGAACHRQECHLTGCRVADGLSLPTS